MEDRGQGEEFEEWGCKGHWRIQPISKEGAKTGQLDENGSFGPAKYSFQYCTYLL